MAHSPEGPAIEPAPSAKPSLMRAAALLLRHKPRVALVFHESNSFVRMMLEGIFSYTRETRSWAFSVMDRLHVGATSTGFGNWTGDGMIVHVRNRDVTKAILASSMPVVDLSIGRCLPEASAVMPNSKAIAHLAMDHFIGRGLRNFSYCEDVESMWSKRCADAFRVEVAAAGFHSHEFKCKPALRQRSSSEVGEIGRWLLLLPKPVAVFAASDKRGQQVLEACSNMGFAVPDEVAVLGVGNDELVCEMSTPPLSSVMPNAHRIGYEAARLLDRLMQGQSEKPREYLVEPGGVHLRQSTDMLAVGDNNVAMALRYIREHVCELVTPDNVLRAVRIPRRSLEKRFRLLLNRTLHEEIIASRLNHVKKLLLETRLSLEQIAAAMNYEHPEYLSVVFKREIGLTPREFRSRHGCRINMEGSADAP